MLSILGTFDANGVRFNNYQLQLNGRQSFPSTIDQVNIQRELIGYDDSKGRGIKRLVETGLHHDLNAAAIVWIYQQIRDKNGKPMKP